MRQANSTIRGYQYQFNKSIFEILCADEEEQIILEGVIEDIDIQSKNSITTIQCKYHEDQKYQISNVAEPILEMLCHYQEQSVIGKNMSYILYAYYATNVECIDKKDFLNYINSTKNKEIMISYFHRIFTITDSNILEIANKIKKSAEDKKKLLEYYEANRNSLALCVDLENFWKCFKYYKAEQYDNLCQQIKDKLSDFVEEELVENLYYPNAFFYISNLSAKPKVSQRTITKRKLLEFLKEQKSILINRWMLVAFDKRKILKDKKRHLESFFSSNADVRAFIFSDKFNEVNNSSIIGFLHSYLSKYFKKTKLQKPPIFIFDNNSENLSQEAILGLYKYQKYVNNGMVASSFIEENFINNNTGTEKVACRITMLKNITIDLLEKCNVNQLYIIGHISKELYSHNYIIENLDVENIATLKYLVGLEKTLEV